MNFFDKLNYINNEVEKYLRTFTMIGYTSDRPYIFREDHHVPLELVVPSVCLTLDMDEENPSNTAEAFKGLIGQMAANLCGKICVAQTEVRLKYEPGLYYTAAQLEICLQMWAQVKQAVTYVDNIRLVRLPLGMNYGEQTSLNSHAMTVHTVTKDIPHLYTRAFTLVTNKKQLVDYLSAHTVTDVERNREALVAALEVDHKKAIEQLNELSFDVATIANAFTLPPDEALSVLKKYFDVEKFEDNLVWIKEHSGTYGHSLETIWDQL